MVLPMVKLQDCQTRLSLLRRVWVLTLAAYQAYRGWTSQQPVASLDPQQVTTTATRGRIFRAGLTGCCEGAGP